MSRLYVGPKRYKHQSFIDVCFDCEYEEGIYLYRSTDRHKLNVLNPPLQCGLDTIKIHISNGISCFRDRNVTLGIQYFYRISKNNIWVSNITTYKLLEHENKNSTPCSFQANASCVETGGYGLSISIFPVTMSNPNVNKYFRIYFCRPKTQSNFGGDFYCGLKFSTDSVGVVRVLSIYGQLDTFPTVSYNQLNPTTNILNIVFTGLNNVLENCKNMELQEIDVNENELAEPLRCIVPSAFYTNKLTFNTNVVSCANLLINITST